MEGPTHSSRWRKIPSMVWPRKIMTSHSTWSIKVDFPPKENILSSLIMPLKVIDGRVISIFVNSIANLKRLDQN
jgi:hypothetical protein